MHIARYINDLLYNHDCVIIPGLGGFVCSYRPAKIHPVQHQFYPPSKTILFNRELQNNDGLLANKLVSLEGITYQEALKLIEAFGKEILAALNQGTRVRMEQIGIFYLDEEGNIQFEQDHRVNHLKDAYGLSGLVSPPVLRQRKPLHQSAVPVFRDRKPEKSAGGPRKAVRWSMVVIPSALLVGLIAFNMHSFKQAITSETSLFPLFEARTETSVVQHPVVEKNKNTLEITLQDQPEVLPGETLENPTESKPLEEETIIAAGNLDPGAVNPSPEKEAVSEVIQPPVQKYYLIAGSFAEVENAEKLMSGYRSKGYQPAIIGQASNGYHRVSIAAFPGKNEALAELRKVRDLHNPNVWLLKQ